MSASAICGALSDYLVSGGFMCRLPSGHEGQHRFTQEDARLASEDARLVYCEICHKTHAVRYGETPCAPGAWRETALPSSSGPDAGLHGKYYGLRRTRDDSVVDGWYFVIRENDEAGWAGLEAYAAACESYEPELAADLRRHIRDERLAAGLYDAGWER